jgi:hypothetical protein
VAVIHDDDRDATRRAELERYRRDLLKPGERLQRLAYWLLGGALALLLVALVLWVLRG